jgi:hypothetical protein
MVTEAKKTIENKYELYDIMMDCLHDAGRLRSINVDVVKQRDFDSSLSTAKHLTDGVRLEQIFVLPNGFRVLVAVMELKD